MIHDLKDQVIGRTLVFVKPEGVVRGLVGEIIRRFEQRGLRLVGLKMLSPSAEHIDAHYPKDTEWIAGLGKNTITTANEYQIDLIATYGSDDALTLGKQFRQFLIDYVKEKPVVAMVIEGPHAVEVVRKIVGPTRPNDAPPGTIRGDYSVDSSVLANSQGRPISNIVHASGTADEAEREIKHWFRAEELIG